MIRQQENSHYEVMEGMFNRKEKAIQRWRVKKVMQMKKTLVIGLALLMIGTMIGCGAPKKEESKDVAQTEDKNVDSKDEVQEAEKKSEGTELTYWYWADSTEANELLLQIIDEYNKTNDYGVTIIPEEQAWDNGGYNTTLLTACMDGGGPDIAMFRTTAASEFLANGLLTDLDDYLGAWEGYESVDSNIWNEMVSAGDGENCYIMPWTTQVLYVYYRPSIFEKAGVAIPETYDELLEAIKACTIDEDGDGKTDIYGWGMRGASGGQEAWGSFITAAGGSWDDLTGDASVKGMQDFIDIYKNGYAPESAPNDGYAEILANFQSGLTAMMVHHTSSSAAMTAALGDDVGAFVFPANEAGERWIYAGYCNNVIMSDSKDKDAAFDFISYLASGEAAEKWSLGTMNLPVSSSVQELESISGNPFVQVSLQGIPYSGSLPNTPTLSEWISSTWPTTMQQALLGEISAKDAMQTIKDGLYQ